MHGAVSTYTAQITAEEGRRASENDNFCCSQSFCLIRDDRRPAEIRNITGQRADKL